MATSNFVQATKLKRIGTVRRRAASSCNAFATATFSSLDIVSCVAFLNPILLSLQACRSGNSCGEESKPSPTRRVYSAETAWSGVSVARWFPCSDMQNSEPVICAVMLSCQLASLQISSGNVSGAKCPRIPMQDFKSAPWYTATDTQTLDELYCSLQYYQPAELEMRLLHVNALCEMLWFSAKYSKIDNIRIICRVLCAVYSNAPTVKVYYVIQYYV